MLINRKFSSFCILSLLIVSGCATQPSIDQLAPRQKLVIQTPMDMPSTNYVHVSNKAAREVARSMGSEAALGGAAITGLTCGSLFLICAPIGLVTGAIVGSSVGEAVGHSMNLDPASGQLISTNIQAHFANSSVHEQVADILRHKAAYHFELGAPNAPNRLRIQVTRLQLNSHGSSGVALHLVAEINMTRQLDKNNLAHSKQQIRYTSMVLPVDQWINGDSAFYQRMLASAYHGLVEMIISNLLGE